MKLSGLYWCSSELKGTELGWKSFHTEKALDQQNYLWYLLQTFRSFDNSRIDDDATGKLWGHGLVDESISGTDGRVRRVEVRV